MKRLFLLMLIILWASVLFAQDPEEYSHATKRITREFIADIPEDVTAKHSKIAVGWFVCGKSNYTGSFGELLSTDISNTFVRDKTFKVVSRNDLNKLMEEKKFWLSDLVSSDTIPKAPEGFSAFTLLVRGKYFADVRKDTVDVRAEIVDVLTSEIISVASATINRASLPVPLDANELHRAELLSASLAETSAAVTDPARSVRVRVWAAEARKVFRAGDELRFKVAVDRDAYVRLFNIRPDGSTIMIFPNAFHSDNFVRAAETLVVPSGKMEFKFIAESPFGPEAVQAVATTSHIVSNYIGTRGLDSSNDTADPFKAVENGSRGLADIIRDARSRGIAVEPQGESTPAWAEDHWTFVTEKK